LSTLSVEEFVGHLRHGRRSGSHLINYSKKREKLRTLKEEDNNEEVKEAFLMVEVMERKRRKNNLGSKIGMEEDKVREEEVD